ncbi:MAG: ATP-binding cassette domain-containing protein [Candidatus Wildermuthbacteria bacterium]|nr:ATP-binding cassette domain-containing protein [Candidatus Wildermuthbacteria bacterium]
MIHFQKIGKAYGTENIVLRDVSFEVEEGEFVSLVGKSGAGKTTLLRLFLAEEFPSHGSILFQQRNVHEIPESKLHEHRRKIGVVFQDYKLLPFKTAEENISYVMEILGANEQDIARDVKDVLDIVGLSDRALHFPYQLSGGEKQRVAIARALIHRPQVIVADEPTGNLDPYNTKDIIRLLLKINELGTTTILATHNKEVVNQIEKRVLTLEGGTIIRDQEKGRFVM